MSADIFPILEKKCTQCHGDNGHFTVGKTPGELYASITQLAAGNCAPPARQQKRVDPDADPRAPTEAFLYRKISTTDCGTKMAVNGRLTQLEIGMILNWISEGAKNN